MTLRGFIWDVRTKVSLLLDHGHPDAFDYPIRLVWEEADLVNARLSRQLASETTLIQMAISTMFSPEAGKEFTKLTKLMSEG